MNKMSPSVVLATSFLSLIYIGLASAATQCGTNYCSGGK
jgi:hypothetical protein